jgi:hypothetical protein
MPELARRRGMVLREVVRPRAAALRLRAFGDESTPHDASFLRRAKAC